VPLASFSLWRGSVKYFRIHKGGAALPDLRLCAISQIAVDDFSGPFEYAGTKAF
jgi:hypothetical protein